MIQATYSVGESTESTDNYDLKNILVFIILEGGVLYGCKKTSKEGGKKNSC
jgi:hypothetical protein